MTVAALFVDPRGCYADAPDVELWDQARDATLYPGPHPVVAHPPCSRWCRLAGLVQARYPHLRKREDGGLFESALRSVREWGGVLEHPAWSAAWHEFGLPIPDARGGWQRGLCGGWSCHVEQGRYGHPAKKATWLYAFGVEPPPLRWGFTPDHESSAVLSWCGPSHANHRWKRETWNRVSRRMASATPPEFRDVLLKIARSAPARLLAP